MIQIVQKAKQPKMVMVSEIKPGEVFIVSDRLCIRTTRIRVNGNVMVASLVPGEGSFNLPIDLLVQAVSVRFLVTELEDDEEVSEPVAGPVAGQ